MTTKEISAKEVKALRDRTGAGMMDCKAALQESAGDMEKAIDILRTTGRREGSQARGAQGGRREP